MPNQHPVPHLPNPTTPRRYVLIGRRLGCAFLLFSASAVSFQKAVTSQFPAARHALATTNSRDDELYHIPHQMHARRFSYRRFPMSAVSTGLGFSDSYILRLSISCVPDIHGRRSHHGLPEHEANRPSSPQLRPIAGATTTTRSPRTKIGRSAVHSKPAAAWQNASAPMV